MTTLLALVVLAVGQPPIRSFTLEERPPAFHPPVGRVPEPSLAEERPENVTADALRKPLRDEYLTARQYEMKRRRENSRLYHLSKRPYRYASYERAQSNYAAAVRPYVAQGYGLHQLAVARYAVSMNPPSCWASRRRY